MKGGNSSSETAQAHAAPGWYANANAAFVPSSGGKMVLSAAWASATASGVTRARK